MKIKNLKRLTVFCLFLFTPVLSQASDYNDAVTDANSSIDKTTSTNGDCYIL